MEARRLAWAALSFVGWNERLGSRRTCMSGRGTQAHMMESRRFHEEF